MNRSGSEAQILQMYLLFIGCEATEGFETTREVAGVQDVGQMTA
jgi:hypothetical protein